MSKLLQDVVGELSKLPGVGRRTALRLAIHILRMERDSVAEMTASIDRFRNEVKYCSLCNNQTLVRTWEISTDIIQQIGYATEINR